jgi:ATP-dependent RNA helicase DeaD
MIDRLLDEGYASTDICSALIHLLQGGEGGSAGGPAASAKKAKPEVERVVPNALPPVAGKPSAQSPESGPELRESASATTRSTSKPKFDRPARTGREKGMKTLFLNVGRKQLVTPADIVGKIAGVTRLPAEVVGALDIHQRHTLVDVAEAHADAIVRKLAGIKVKGVALAPTLATTEGE